MSPQKFCPLFLIIPLFLGLIVFGCKTKLIEPGVSEQLAAERKAYVSEVNYDLNFHIPKDKNDSIPASVKIKQQVMNVSFVAPSSVENQKNAKKINKNLLAENAIKEEVNKKSYSKNETSGIQNKNATNNLSANSEPIFDAAYLNNQAPAYPSMAKKRNIQGKVLLVVLVKEDGSAAKVEVSRSSGSSILDNAAIDAVKNWQFIPAKKFGKAVSATVIVPIDFKLV